MSSKPIDYGHQAMLGTRDDGKISETMHTSLIGIQPTSVIIPTMNEGANIANLLIRLDRAMAQEGIVYEAIVVDDHSSDDTIAIAEFVARDRNLPVRVLLKQGRPGKAFSLIEGFAVAQFDVLAMIDGDLQYPPEVLPDMECQLAHFDIVVADRRSSYHSINRPRAALSKMLNFILSVLFGVSTDMQSGLKVFHRKVYEDIALNPSSWSFDLHFIPQAVHKGYLVTNTPITFQQRLGGESKVRFLTVAMELVIEALRVKRLLFAHKLINSFRTHKGKDTGHKNSPHGEAVPKALISDLEIAEQVGLYSAWLAEDSERTNNQQHDTNDYIDDALKIIRVGDQKIRPFAPFRFNLSALQTVTFGQILGLGVIGLTLLLGLVFYRVGALLAIIAVITVLYFSNLLLNFFLATRTLSHSVENHIDDAIVQALADANWPQYTILCPLYHEAAVVPQFVQAMQALDYATDKLQVLLLTEEDDDETRNAIQAMRLPQHFKIVTVPAGKPRTKARACNFGLLLATGKYVVIYDAEDIPDPLQLKKAVLTFANHGPDLACVQAKLNFYNTEQNLLTRWFAAEYSSWFDLILPGLQQAQLPLPLGGTSNHFRTEVLRVLGAWDAFNVTEDCDLGLRLARCRLKTTVLDSTTYEEANSRMKNWLRQRSRWIKGYMQTYLVHMRQPLLYLRLGHLREFLALQLVIGGKTAVLFVNPLMWILLAIYILFHSIVGHAYHTLFPAPVFYMAVMCLIFGNFFYAYTHLIGCMKRNQYGLIKWTLFIPIYWIMMSMAAFIALFQLIFKPHYWEKTQHGFHLSRSRSSPYPDDQLTPPRASNTASRKEERNGEMTSEVQTSAAALNVPALAETLFKIETVGRPPRNGQSWHVFSHKISVKTGFPDDEARVAGSPTSAIQTLDLEAMENVRLPAHEHTEYLSLGRPKHISLTSSTKVASISSPSLISLIEAIETVKTVPLPVFENTKRLLSTPLKRPAWQFWRKDIWLTVTFITACIASVAAFCYFFLAHQILLDGDSYSHMLIARRVLDNATPGLAQLGSVWLPLPHLLMMPLIWNDYLWRTGLAGSIPSMCCYLVTAVYLFLSARRLTRDSRASFVGTLLFILNPNILYLQATPLSELVLVATLTAACYFFLAWAQDDKPKQLIWAAASTFLATMARYDGWLLFLAFLILIVIIGWVRHRRWSEIEGSLFVFGTLGGLGIALWLLWCGIIFGDPLYFQRGPFSAQVQQKYFIQEHLLYTYHNLWESIRYYMIGSMITLGPLLLALGITAVLVFVLRRRISPDMFAALAFLVPVVFYIFSLYSGQAAFFVPQAVPANAPYPLFNTRYAVMVVAPAALFLSTLAGRWSTRSHRRSILDLRTIAHVVLLVSIVVQTALVAYGGIITLQDGEYGLSCEPQHPAVIYLAQHYAGGRILEDLYTSKIAEPEMGIDFKNFVYEGSGEVWQKSLDDPSAMVDWIIIDQSNPSDLVAQRINVKSSHFLSEFILTVQERDGILLFHRNKLSPLPTRPISPDLLYVHLLCRTNVTGQHGKVFVDLPSQTVYQTYAVQSRVWKGW